MELGAQGAVGDTWGISGPEFLVLYLVIAVGAVVAALMFRRAALMDTSRSPGAQVLNPVEAAILFDDRRAVLAALAELRGYEYIESDGAPLLALGPATDPFVRSVFDRLASGAQRRVGAIVTASIVPLAQLRTRLIEYGYLCGPQQRRAVGLAAIPVWAVVAIGGVRLVAGAANHRSVGFLVVVVLVLVAVGMRLMRCPRLTPRGEAIRTEMLGGNSHLRPSNAPAFATYGPAAAALSVALFGVAAIWALDPALAAAAGMMAPGVSGGGGGHSCSSGDTGSSCGSSSSCGGGGCGG